MSNNAASKSSSHDFLICYALKYWLNHIVDDVEDVEREGSGDENDAGEEGAGEPKQEYVKKEYYARPYVSQYGTEEAVKSLTTKNNR